jgi:hypothetical protein
MRFIHYCLFACAMVVAGTGPLSPAEAACIEIKTVEDLQNINIYRGENYCVTQDIDASSADALRPIESFSGILDGGGHGARCSPRGYKNQDKTPFRINGNYVGTNCGNGKDPTLFLSSDGHSGYDYAFAKLTPVLAPADGELHKAQADLVNIPKGCETLTAWEAWHAFYIDHGNGYTTWYLHADALDPAIESQIGSDYTKSAHVSQGDRIAFSGTFGPCGNPDSEPPQLHFEVRKGLNEVVDPYSEAFWIAP